jgi:hypothetical protein
MATSGSKVYSLTTQQIINDAFYKAGIYRKGASIPNENYTGALEDLNLIAKSWQSQGFNIWNDKRAYLFTQYNTASYSLGNTAHCTESYDETTLNGAIVSGAGSVVLTSATGVTDGDFIGIIKDSGLIFWTTINGLVGKTATLTTVIDGDCADGNVVFTYTTKITKPLEIVDVTLQQNSSNEVLLTPLSRQEYFLLANKQALGSPNQYYYQRRRTDTLLYIWTTPSDVSQVINLTYQPYLDNFVNQADNPDLPIEWGQALKYALASELCVSHGVAEAQFAKVNNKADYWFSMARSNDNEDTSLTFGEM